MIDGTLLVSGRPTPELIAEVAREIRRRHHLSYEGGEPPPWESISELRRQKWVNHVANTLDELSKRGVGCR